MPGDIANTLNIINSVAFVVSVVAQHRGYINIFSESFVKDGFCVSNQDKSVYMQSHFMCFIADSAYSVVLWLFTAMCATGMEEASVKPVRHNILGILFHGFGHLYVALDGRVDERTDWERNKDDPFKLSANLFTFFFFWYFLTRSGNLHEAFGNFGHVLIVLTV